MKTSHEHFMAQDFPRIKQPKPEFPEVVENNFEPTDQQVEDYIHNIDKKLYI